jgi:hypothetical protein
MENLRMENLSETNMPLGVKDGNEEKTHERVQNNSSQFKNQVGIKLLAKGAALPLPNEGNVSENNSGPNIIAYRQRRSKSASKIVNAVQIAVQKVEDHSY